MRSIRHPLSGAIYDLTSEGTIQVTASDGASGIFTASGSYVSGDLYFADPHLCGWIGGRELRMRPRNAPAMPAKNTTP